MNQLGKLSEQVRTEAMSGADRDSCADRDSFADRAGDVRESISVDPTIMAYVDNCLKAIASQNQTDRRQVSALVPRSNFATPKTFDPKSPEVRFADETVFNPGERFGRFQIVKELGSGGFGRVYLVDDTGLSRQVALKIPYAAYQSSPMLRRQLHSEGKVSVGLDHPGIVPVLEAGEHNGIPFLVSAFCEGDTLATWLKTRPDSPDQRVVAQLMLDLSSAVAYLHSRGVLHRDLKPANIILESTRDPSQEPRDVSVLRPRVTDFGLAKLLRTSVDQSLDGLVVGTPSYMSPEQAAGRVKDVGTHSDVYSLGAILYELLVGHPPFTGNDGQEIRAKVLAARPRSPSHIHRGVNIDLDAICMKCLEKAPTNRYADARDLATDLNRFLNDESVVARPIDPLKRVARYIRRKPFTSAAVAMFAIFVAIIGYWALRWHHVHSEHRRSDSRAASSRRSDQLSQEHQYKEASLELEKQVGEEKIKSSLLFASPVDHVELADLLWKKGATLLASVSTREEPAKAFRESIEHLTIAADNNPENRDHLVNKLLDLATWYRENGDFDSACAAIFEAIKLCEKWRQGANDSHANQLSYLSAKAYHYLGGLSLSRPDYKDTIKCIDNARELAQAIDSGADPVLKFQAKCLVLDNEILKAECLYRKFVQDGASDDKLLQENREIVEKCLEDRIFNAKPMPLTVLHRLLRFRHLLARFKFREGDAQAARNIATKNFDDWNKLAANFPLDHRFLIGKIKAFEFKCLLNRETLDPGYSNAISECQVSLRLTEQFLIELEAAIHRKPTNLQLELERAVLVHLRTWLAAKHSNLRGHPCDHDDIQAAKEAFEQFKGRINDNALLNELVERLEDYMSMANSH
jgi:tRNA A-37 threonylcarbamoyl transferase component Bud32/tetratricopeptide (TPR) repeat protein